MNLVDPMSAILFIKRKNIQDTVRQALKSQGFKSEAIHNTTDEKQCLDLIQRQEYAILVLDWESGVDRIQSILEGIRRKSHLESHPILLFIRNQDEHVVAVAKEYFVHSLAAGEVTTESIQESIQAIVHDYLNISPVRKILLAAETACRNQQEDVAQDLLERLLERQSQNLRVVIALAESYIRQDAWSKVEGLLREFAQMPSSEPRIRHLHARCLMKRGDYEGAIAALKDAQLLSPYHVERLLEMGNLFLHLDRPVEAGQAFDAALLVAPNSKAAKLGKSTGKMLIGDINEALQLLRTQANPRELGAVFNTAAVLAVKAQRFDIAIELYQKAMQVLLKHEKLIARIQYNLGLAYVKAGRLEEGLHSFQKALVSDSSFRDAQHNLQILMQLQARSKVSEVGETEALDPFSQGFLSKLDEALDITIPMTTLNFDQSDETVALDEVFRDTQQTSTYKRVAQDS